MRQLVVQHPISLFIVFILMFQAQIVYVFPLCACNINYLMLKKRFMMLWMVNFLLSFKINN